MADDDDGLPFLFSPTFLLLLVVVTVAATARHIGSRDRDRR